MSQRASQLWAILAVLVPGLLYLRTLAPGVLWGDGAEWQTIVPLGGVPHPTGYPTYTWIAWLATRAVPGSEAFGVNLFSALCAAAAVLLVHLFIRSLGASPPAAAVGALAFGLAPALWSQAIVAEVYALNAFFLTLLLLLFRRALLRQTWPRWCVFVAVYALALGNHLTLALLVPAFAGIWLWHGRHRLATTLLQLAGGAALGLLVAVLVYATLRVGFARGPTLGWSAPRTLPELVDYVTGASFRTNMFALSGRELPARLTSYASELRHQFPLVLLPLGLWGLWTLRPRTLALLLILVAAVSVYWAINYDFPISELLSYFLPSYLVVAVLVGVGMENALRLVRSRWIRGEPATWPGRAAAAALVGAALLALLPATRTNLRTLDMRQVTWPDTEGRAILEVLPRRALLLSDWNRSTTLWYLQHVEGVRRDVRILNRDPKTWAAEVDRARGERQIYLADRNLGVEESHRVRRNGPVYRVLPPHGERGRWRLRDQRGEGSSS